jgi:hypothetical protein
MPGSGRHKDGLLIDTVGEDRGEGNKEAVKAVSGTRRCTRKYTEVNNNKIRDKVTARDIGYRLKLGGVAYKDVHLFFCPGAHAHGHEKSQTKIGRPMPGTDEG